jgi:hypothetical protein
LLTQIAVFDRLHDLMKFGMAMVASKPTVETTIIISTIVKPRDGWFPLRPFVITRSQAIRSPEPVQPGNRWICRRESTGSYVGWNTNPLKKRARE